MKELAEKLVAVKMTKSQYEKLKKLADEEKRTVSNYIKHKLF